MFFLSPVPFSVVSATHFLVDWFLTWPLSLDASNMWYFAPSNLVLVFLILSTIQLCFLFTLHTNLFLVLIYFSHRALHFCIHLHLLIFSYVAYALPSKWRAEQYLVFTHFLFGGHCLALYLLFISSAELNRETVPSSICYLLGEFLKFFSPYLQILCFSFHHGEILVYIF